MSEPIAGEPQAQGEEGQTLDEALAAEQLLEELPYDARTMGQMVWRSFRRHKPAMIGSAIILLFVLAAVFASYISPYDPEKTDLDNVLQPPSTTHLMGTDDLGRDLLTRILYGGRISLSIGVMAMSLAVIVGAVVGGITVVG